MNNYFRTFSATAAICATSAAFVVHAQTMSGKVMDSSMMSMDANKDGMISKFEFPGDKMMLVKFDMMDMNRDGMLDRSEMTDMGKPDGMVSAETKASTQNYAPPTIPGGMTQRQVQPSIDRAAENVQDNLYRNGSGIVTKSGPTTNGTEIVSRGEATERRGEKPRQAGSSNGSASDSSGSADSGSGQ